MSKMPRKWNDSILLILNGNSKEGCLQKEIEIMEGMYTLVKTYSVDINQRYIGLLGQVD